MDLSLYTYYIIVGRYIWVSQLKFIFLFLLFRYFTGAIAKCAAGGRDHTSCCIRRGVPDTCLPYCRGLLPETPVNCLALYGGSIIECYDEGKSSHIFSFPFYSFSLYLLLLFCYFTIRFIGYDTKKSFYNFYECVYNFYLLPLALLIIICLPYPYAPNILYYSF